MKDTFRRLRIRARERLESLRPSSDEVESPIVEGQVASDRISTDSRQQHSEITRQEDRVDVAAEPRDTSESTSQFGKNRSPIENIDGSSWANIWPEAYQNVKTDPEHSELLQKLERFLEGEGGRLEANDVKLWDDPSGATDDSSRLKTIQKNAEETLGNFSEVHLSFKIRDKPIVVRESILKVVQVINTLKPVIGGAVAAEPSAALAWAGVTTILPILENVFQQDEDAATGLTNIIFLLARYQGFYERDFTSQLASLSGSGASQELLNRVRDELVSVYGKIYVYEARFILQYGKRNKAHRALRNALSADDWKKSWSDIESISNRIDKGVAAQVNTATLETWKAVKDVQEHVARVEAMQNDFDRRQLLLSLQVTGNASYDSYRSSKVEAPCLPGTQRHILQTIQEWTENSQSEMILWLEGMAGTGKTSIALTVASALEARKPFTDILEHGSKAFLGASFFFSQGDTTRNNIFELFRTIAWCLADMSPEFGKHVTNAIKDNPGIQTKVPLQQLQKLIIGPLTILDESKYVPLLLIVVIDALDECDKEDAQDLLGMLIHLRNLHQIRLRFLITSRPEEHIATSFAPLLSGLCRRIQLNKIKSATDKNNDIVYYLSETLKEIAKTQGVADDGVSNADIIKLAEKADGLFIYAATACRFLTPNFAHKTLRDEHLALIFDGEIEEDGPQQKVDGIYLKVLAFPDIQKSHKRVQTTFYVYISRLIGFMVVLFRPASVETLFHLLHTATPGMTEKMRETVRRDLHSYLRRLHSIINVPEEAGIPLSLAHLSFRDFVLDQERSKRLPFSIDELSMHREVLHRCFVLMNSKLRQNICCLSLPGSLVSDVDPSHISYHIPQYLQYACRYWVEHLLKADRKFLTHTTFEDTEDHSSAGLVYKLLKEKLLYWLEVMAFIGEAPSIIPMFSQLERSIELSTNPDLSSLLLDAKRFVLNNRWIIEHTPLQMYCSALLFCPRESLVRSYYQTMIPVWITKKPQTQQTWTAELSTLVGHTGHICDTAFSPTETLLASVSGDNTTRVWDYVTGSEKYRFEDPGKPLKVCFSADGLSLASGCLDGTVRVRDLRNGTEVSLHSPSYVKGMLFSPISRNIVASICNENILRVWDIAGKRQLLALQLPDSGKKKHIVFSPDGKLVAVCLYYSAALCNVELGQLVHEFLPHKRLKGFTATEYICGLSISTNSRIVAVRFDHSIDIWEIMAPNPKLIRTYEVAWSEYSPFLFISPGEMIKVCQSHTHLIDLFDLTTGDLIGTFLKSFVKQDPNAGPLRADIPPYHPLIRILSGPSTSRFRGREKSAPENVKFSLDNEKALSYSFSTETKQWNTIDGSMKAFEVNVQALTYSPDGEFVLLQLSRGDKFQVWDKSLTRKVATYEQWAYMDFVPDTSHLISLSLAGNFKILCHDPGRLSFETVNEFSLPAVYFRSKRRLSSERAKPFYVSPNGEVVAVVLDYHDPNHYSSHGHASYLLQIWNIPRWEKIGEFRFPVIRQIVFSPDSRYMAVEFRGRTLLLHISNEIDVKDWNLYDGISITFHPSRRMFGIVSGKNKTVSVWEGTPLVKRFMLQSPESFRVRSIAFSTTNKLVALSNSYDTGSIIEIWDTTTKQIIGSQNLILKGFAFSLRFSKKEVFLVSSRGRLPLPTQDIADASPDKSLDGLHKCLYVLDDWVYQGRERLIWLPPSYRPPTSETRNIEVQGDTIAISYEGNSVKFIGISLEDTPVAKHYLGLVRK
ncbi:uncharacterized protein FMAN_11903 [Fusarium mangiferae]|uniref:NACHT domain-containing protein n=1 Tax=Fusarium mangiferae TaxID=192010 RepID=A0A1L7UGF1_FUSMA|nr:uncharacterized protein FMAN_11903 [Fusarium mangiferae]CVL06807.1 uncharacterized protein FMAN_11903 [Fusarium mangiferae]